MRWICTIDSRKFNLPQPLNLDYTADGQSPALTDFLKLNVDGAVFNHPNMSGMGAILRDGQGNTVLAASMVEHNMLETEEAELLGIFRGLQLCTGRGIKRIIVESDNLTMVKECQKIGEICIQSLRNKNHLFIEISTLKNMFEECLFGHVYREQNRVAHEHARHAWQLENVAIWNVIPDFVSQASWLDLPCNT